MGKYDGLIAHLMEQGGANLALPMTAIDALVLGGLPQSRSRPTWWSSDKRPWFAAGFDAQLEPAGPTVTSPQP